MVNRSPSTTIDCNIPEEVWRGHPCDYLNLKVFSYDAYALVPNSQRSKLDLKSKKYVFVGYGHGVKGCILWDPTSQNIIINRDVVFDEMSLMKSNVEGCELKQVEEPQIQRIQWEIRH